MVSRRATCSLLALAVLTAAAGACRKKPPATAPTVEPPPAAAAGTAPSATAPAPAADDPFAADLAALNDYVRREGLLGTVFFDYDSSELSQEARERLTANARFLGQRPELVVAIEGHADDRGTNEYNLALGERRAGAARDLVQRLGIGSERLRAISYGEERPECGDPSESCWARNRRAQFVIVGRSNVG